MEATRRWRARVRAGEAVALVTITAEILDLLVRTHWVDERDACDRAEVGRPAASPAHHCEQRRDRHAGPRSDDERGCFSIAARPPLQLLPHLAPQFQ